jgi:exopolysaccharide biosynthesis polyprenyl glycosylphosphotransferase
MSVPGESPLSAQSLPPGSEGARSAAAGRRPSARILRRRGWLTRRMLVLADVLGLTIAFLVVELLFGSQGAPDAVHLTDEMVLFALALPAWLLGAKLFGLYDRDEERAAHSTPDDLVRVFLLATVGAFLITHTVGLTRSADPDLTKVTVFWAVAILGVTAARIAARAFARRRAGYFQNTVIVGAGEIGQLIARKLLQHREYGIRLLGFVDASPMALTPSVNAVPVIGSLEQLEELVERQDVERVIFAFSGDNHRQVLPHIRSLRDAGVQVDVVPRLFEVIGPKVDIHTVEGISLIGLPPVRLPRSSRMIKRALDVAVAAVGVILAIPLVLVLALMIKRDSPGPVFFRQRRLGKDRHEFTLLKFRTMRADTDDSAHRAFISETMSYRAAPETNGLYKLEREDAVTRIGAWLRRTSLDELPQLINVLRGDMSLVGPRPCIAYELERFEPHHFDRFLVPAGLTGLWQTSARAHSTFGEALDMDVLYAQSWSLGLDLLLLARTPLQVLRPSATA